MTTIFKLLKTTCGLSNPEAAAFLDVSVGAVNAWMRGHRTPPESVIQMLADLAALVEDVADELLEKFMFVGPLQKESGTPLKIDIEITDDVATDFGLPASGPLLAALGIAIARGMDDGYKFEIVNASTP